MWERWNGDQMRGDPSMNSYNHYAYGAVADWIYRYAAGVDATPPTPASTPLSSSNIRCATGKSGLPLPVVLRRDTICLVDEGNGTVTVDWSRFPRTQPPTLHADASQQGKFTSERRSVIQQQEASPAK